MSQDKVSWTREQTLANGTKIAVSEKSGITKVTVQGTGRRAVMLYHDEMLALLACAGEIQQFLNANQDVAFSKEQAKETKQVKRTQIKTQAKVIQGLEALGYDQETINKFISQKVS